MTEQAGRLHATGTPLENDQGTGFTCPECGASRFDLQLGGRASGRIECSSCGYPVEPGRHAAGYAQ